MQAKREPNDFFEEALEEQVGLALHGNYVESHHGTGFLINSLLHASPKLLGGGRLPECQRARRLASPNDSPHDEETHLQVTFPRPYGLLLHVPSQ